MQLPAADLPPDALALVVADCREEVDELAARLARDSRGRDLYPKKSSDSCS
jgi:hypothetical protein